MKYSPAFLKLCRPLYRIGTLAITIGVLAIIGGFVLAVLGKGWMSLLIGIGVFLVGIIVGQIAEVYVSMLLKSHYEDLNSKETHELVATHLQARGDDAE